MSESAQPPRSALTRAVYAALAVVVLLGVVAYASRGHEPPTGGHGGHTRAPVQYFFDIVFTLVLVVGLSMLVLLAFLRAKMTTRKRQVDFRAIFLIVGFVAAFLIAAIVIADKLGNDEALRGRLGNRIGGAGGTTLERAKDPEFHWPVALGTIALLAAGLAVVIARERRRRSEGARERELAHRLAEVLDDTLDDLRAEPDPRRAVIAAYARMERTLAAHGLPRREADAPLEYLTRVLRDLQVGERAIRGLTDLFAVAKFSDHTIGPKDKERAIEALESLRDDLRQTAAAADEAPPLSEPAAGRGTAG